MASKADIATEFLSLCASGKVREAYDRHVAENFRHHNAYFPGDRDSLLTAMEQSAQSEPNKSFTVRQTIESADRVAVMSHLRRAHVDLEYAVVHILRFEEGRIAEMWDVAQEIPRDSPNQLGMF
ncbi:MAG TPA: ester cyclase [Rhodanobacter sp.]|nr:ester cyclase [Rhodanobacter sp.]